ncbi:hypothetical protein SAV14893_082360 [Streptomyces avermitilis]|uniref:Uncharacterized protein n=1 Tax=Streptomyces avermitilis TaxID=33903 RepID=A0A4D4MAG3_STRAX|nr:hypothetical protein SAV14893_082360 [Streptomyces avermitilis]
MVVQGGVEVGVSGSVAAVLVGAAGCLAEELVFTAVRDAAELLDVDVEQFVGPGAFVAAHGFAGGPVTGCQGGQAVTAQHAVSGGGGDAASGGQPHRSDAVLAAQAHDLLLDDGRGTTRLVVRAAGAVLHPGGSDCR